MARAAAKTQKGSFDGGSSLEVCGQTLFIQQYFETLLSTRKKSGLNQLY